MKVFLRLLKDSLKLECPACSKAKLFHSTFKIVDECPSCKLSFKDILLGDGPSFIVISIMMYIFAPILIMFEIIYEPSLMFHILFSFPCLSIIAIYCYRISKSFMVHHSYYLKILSAKKR